MSDPKERSTSAIRVDETQHVGTPDEIRKRLDQFVRQTYKSWYRFHKASGISKNTTQRWRIGGDRLPRLETLLSFVEQGLSLDWLVTGRDPVEYRDSARALQSMMPYLRRSTGTGQHSAEQVFYNLLRQLTAQQIWEKAATGLQHDFDRMVADLEAAHRYGELVKWAHDSLSGLEQAAAEGNRQAVSHMIAEWRAQTISYLPATLQPGSPTSEAYWEAIDALHWAQYTAIREASAPTEATRSEPANPDAKDEQPVDPGLQIMQRLTSIESVLERLEKGVAVLQSEGTTSTPLDQRPRRKAGKRSNTRKKDTGPSRRGTKRRR